MSPDAQRIAIAEACGWKPLFISCDLNGNPFPGQDVPPDYFNDLNAMHEAETVLILDCEWATYLDRLSVIVAEGSLVHATAAQRAEAFLRTRGKCKEASK
jgi:hypothetical protein